MLARPVTTLVAVVSVPHIGDLSGALGIWTPVGRVHAHAPARAAPSGSVRTSRANTTIRFAAL